MSSPRATWRVAQVRAASIPYSRGCPTSLPFQQLTTIKSPNSPLNPDFLPFIAFCVPKCHGFNSINVTNSTH